jgi:hypothetical protein
MDGSHTDTIPVDRTTAEYIADGNFFVLKFSEFNFEHATAARELMQAHPLGSTAVGRLCDLREAAFNLEPDEIRKLVADRARFRDTNGLKPCSIVVANDYSFGMIRIYQALMDGADENMLITRDYDAAVEWLKSRDET